MKILQIHNLYQNAGGEDQVCSNESDLLRNHGNELAYYIKRNDQISKYSILKQGFITVWNSDTYKSLNKLVRESNFDVAHIHNTFLIISPSSYYACSELGLPVVQTLHNYRFLCANALFIRDGKVCENCIGRLVPWPGVYKGCYRNSRNASAIVAAMLTLHRILGTYQNKVDVYIALTEFSRRKFIQGGLPAEKIVVKPNFVSVDPGQRPEIGNYALFVGRLSAEKGVRTLLEAWRCLPNVPLKIVGDGPLLNETADFINKKGLKQIQILGHHSHDDILSLMKSASFLIVPSEWYETFGMVVIEAYSCGLPVIASRLGALEELVVDGETGMHFTPGNAEDLAAKVIQIWTNRPLCATMGHRARAEYEAKYTAERNYQLLMDIYQHAIAEKR